MDGTERLDRALVSRGLSPTRARARDAILRGAVTVDGVPETKPGRTVRTDTTLGIDDPAGSYVSRAALKLIAGLDAFGTRVADTHALDIGASTGGFTQVLLERGAAHVTALDVGHGQLTASLRHDPRVCAIEGLNARDLLVSHLPHAPDLVVTDVSFISLRLALPPALALAAPGARAVFLVKPQFEVGREGVGKGGIVAPSLAERAANELREWLDGVPGWRSLGLVPSPIAGGDGNSEWLLGGARD